MTIVRGQFDKFLIPGAKSVFIDDYQELPSVYPSVLSVDSSSQAFEDDLVATGLPIAISKPEGEPIAFDRARFRGRVRYVHTGFGLGYEITREAVEDDLYQALNSQGATNLARSMREAEEVTAANVFNNGFTSVQAYDGVSLFNATHTTSTATTLANRPATDVDLSVAAIKASQERFFALKTDRLLRIRMAPSRLIVSDNGWFTAQEILGTRVVTGAASGGEISSIISAEAKNVVTDMGLMPIRWSYLTDVDAWFMLAPQAQTGLRFFWRRKPDPTGGSMDREQVAWFGITARFVAGATRWRGTDGSTGA